MPDETAATTGIDEGVCQWMSEAEAFNRFARFGGKTQSARHIKPLHWYVACRLVVEGGFTPDDVTPRPPSRIERRRDANLLVFDPRSGGGGERTVLGGLKTKNVDVVITKPGLGPVFAVSCKGVTKAFRNLTNRMGETIGECTNLHMTYPALVFGYLVLIRANRRLETALTGTDANIEPSEQLARNDIALTDSGQPIAGIIRFHNALRELTGRRGLRDDVSQYEAVALAMVDMTTDQQGSISLDYPDSDSALRLERFFSTLYLRYDERFVFSAPDLRNVTRRVEWAPASPAFADQSFMEELGYTPRVDGSLGELAPD